MILKKKVQPNTIVFLFVIFLSGVDVISQPTTSEIFHLQEVQFKYIRSIHKGARSDLELQKVLIQFSNRERKEIRKDFLRNYKRWKNAFRKSKKKWIQKKTLTSPSVWIDKATIRWEILWKQEYQLWIEERISIEKWILAEFTQGEQILNEARDHIFLKNQHKLHQLLNDIQSQNAVLKRIHGGLPENEFENVKRMFLQVSIERLETLITLYFSSYDQWNQKFEYFGEREIRDKWVKKQHRLWSEFILEVQSMWVKTFHTCTFLHSESLKPLSEEEVEAFRKLKLSLNNRDERKIRNEFWKLWECFS